MGMPDVWLKVAHAIGSQNFIRMWSILGSEPSCEAPDGGIECKLRPFRSYLRFQRNRYIEELCRRGWGREQIQAEISRQLCENLTPGHISRLMRSGRSRGRP
jgi:hypothetical protein